MARFLEMRATGPKGEEVVTVWYVDDNGHRKIANRQLKLKERQERHAEIVEFLDELKLVRKRTT